MPRAGLHSLNDDFAKSVERCARRKEKISANVSFKLKKKFLTISNDKLILCFTFFYFCLWLIIGKFCKFFVLNLDFLKCDANGPLF